MLTINWSKKVLSFCRLAQTFWGQSAKWYKFCFLLGSDGRQKSQQLVQEVRSSRQNVGCKLDYD